MLEYSNEVYVLCNINAERFLPILIWSWTTIGTMSEFSKFDCVRVSVCPRGGGAKRHHRAFGRGPTKSPVRTEPWWSFGTPLISEHFIWTTLHTSVSLKTNFLHSGKFSYNCSNRIVLGHFPDSIRFKSSWEIFWSRDLENWYWEQKLNFHSQAKSALLAGCCPLFESRCPHINIS